MKTESQIVGQRELSSFGDSLMCVKPGARLPCGFQFLLPVLVTQGFLLVIQISHYNLFDISSAFDYS